MKKKVLISINPQNRLAYAQKIMNSLHFQPILLEKYQMSNIWHKFSRDK